MIIIISIFLVEDPGQARGPEGLGVCVGAGALGAPRPGSRLRPIAADFLWGPEARNYPLNIHLLKGSVSDGEGALGWQGVDAVTCIELVEHLHSQDLEKFPQTVFGVLKPNVVILSTPNRDFNSLFPDWVDGSLRHWDWWSSEVLAIGKGWRIVMDQLVNSLSLEETRNVKKFSILYQEMKEVGRWLKVMNILRKLTQEVNIR